jgi:peptidyl-prolyl cis-trans isomerase D
MFEFIRKSSKYVMLPLLVLIILSFVVVGGLDRYSIFDGRGDTVATVAGHSIKKQDWDTEHQRQVDQARMANPNVDTALLDSPMYRYFTLEGMVRDRVLAAAADKMLLNTTDAKLARVLRSDPSIGRPDGTVDTERYKELVTSQNMTPAMYEAKLRSDLAHRQVLFGVGGTAFAPKSLTDATLDAALARREIQFVRFSPAEYKSKVMLTDADIEAYYKANEAQFKAAEEADIEYVVLDAEAVKKSITVNEQDLKSYYEQNLAAEAAKEQRRASHIMIESPASASSADRAKAKARAEELLAQVRKAPNTFAEVAKKESQDPGSAPNGGDLDFSPRGGFVSKALEDAAFGLKNKGDISGVVESEFGYHIVRLTDIRAPEHRSYEQARPTLEAEYRTQQAQRKFSEIAETFTNTVYEQSDSLQPVADKLKLQIQTAKGVTRTAAPNVSGALASRNFLTALFRPDAIERQRNTEAVEIGPSQLASGRIVKYTAARTLPLAEVKDKVRATLLEQRAAELAKADGEARLKEWQATPAQADARLSKPAPISRAMSGNTPPELINAALRAQPSALPAFVGQQIGDEYVVIKVNKALPREELPEQAMQQASGQVTQAIGAAENLAYYELLKERFKVKFNVPRPAELPAGTIQ